MVRIDRNRKEVQKESPLDGFLIGVDTSRVLSGSDAEIEQQAKVLRVRLDETIQRLETRFPVYLVFTHADSIEGFEDFFKPFDASERAQVWGATIPLDRTRNAHALFDTEFDLLCDVLLRKRLVRLGVPSTPGNNCAPSTFRSPLPKRGGNWDSSRRRSFARIPSATILFCAASI
jgi:type VI secretion system protein ImpL